MKRSIRMSSVVAGVAILVGCDRPQADPGKVDEALPVPANFVAEACRSDVQAQLPRAGSVIVTDFISDDGGGVKLTDRVLEVSGDRITFEREFDKDGPLPPITFQMTQIARLLPSSRGGDVKRVVSYEEQPMAQLAALEKGETARLPIRESITEGMITGGGESVIEVTLRDCGTLRFAGEREPVRVYQTVFSEHVWPPPSASDAAATEAPSERLFYVSDRYGIPLRTDFEPGAYETVTAITLPEG